MNSYGEAYGRSGTVTANSQAHPPGHGRRGAIRWPRCPRWLSLVVGVASAFWAKGVLAQEPEEEPKGREPAMSLAVERLGGLSYGNLSASGQDGSLSVTMLNLGAVNANPFAMPKLAFDVGARNGGWVGISAGFATGKPTVKNGNRSETPGGVTVYSVTPRLGYRIPLHPFFDLTPRVGLTLAGVQGWVNDEKDELSVFTGSLSAELVGALRISPHANGLVGLAYDQTVVGSASTTSKRSSGTSTDEAKGGLMTVQLWLGLGVYL